MENRDNGSFSLVLILWWGKWAIPQRAKSAGLPLN